MCEIMENIFHGSSECGANIFEPEGHDLIGKGTPWGSECSFLFICMVDLYLIVVGEFIHK